MAARAMPAVVLASGQHQDNPASIGGGLPRTSVVGVLGGGQLGKMLAQAAVRPRSCSRRGGGGGGTLLAYHRPPPTRRPPPPARSARRPAWA